MSGTVEEGGTGHSGVLRGEASEDAPVQGTRPRYPTLDREYRSEAASFAAEVDLKSVQEILEGSGLRPIFSSDCREGSPSGGGVPSDDSEAGPDADEPVSDDDGERDPEELAPIRFVAFLGSGKTAVTVGTDGESQINLQVHPNFLDEVIELLKRRNRVLKVTVQ